MARYGAANPSRPYNGSSLVDVLEPFNEVNLLSPASYSDGTTCSSRAADMMAVAKWVITQTGNSPIIGGPSVHDTDTDDGHLNYYDFTRRVLDRLSTNGFYDVRDGQGRPVDNAFVWTMHNYNDVEHDHGANTVAPDRTTYFQTSSYRARTVVRSRKVAEQLNAFGWKGWPSAGPGVPGIFITEGGANLDRLKSIWGFVTDADAQVGQSNLLARSLNRLSNDNEGWGVALTTQYLWYSGPTSSGKSGLFDWISDGPPPRPATEGAGHFFSYLAWKSFPGVV